MHETVQSSSPVQSSPATQQQKDTTDRGRLLDTLHTLHIQHTLYTINHHAAEQQHTHTHTHTHTHQGSSSGGSLRVARGSASLGWLLLSISASSIFHPRPWLPLRTWGLLNCTGRGGRNPDSRHKYYSTAV